MVPPLQHRMMLLVSGKATVRGLGACLNRQHPVFSVLGYFWLGGTTEPWVHSLGSLPQLRARGLPEQLAEVKEPLRWERG